MTNEKILTICNSEQIPLEEASLIEQQTCDSKLRIIEQSQDQLWEASQK